MRWWRWDKFPCKNKKDRDFPASKSDGIGAAEKEFTGCGPAKAGSSAGKGLVLLGTGCLSQSQGDLF